MKRFLAAVLLLTVLAGLCACGRDKEDATISATVAASGSDIAIVPTAPASSTDTAADNAAYETAKQYIGRPAEELIAAIGQPDSTSYASSCLEENAEDGMLMYDADGFYVWTVKNADGETVHEVNLNQ